MAGALNADPARRAGGVKGGGAAEGQAHRHGDLPREIEYLRHNEAIRRIVDAVEMPDRIAEDFVMFVRQHKGALDIRRIERKVDARYSLSPCAKSPLGSSSLMSAKDSLNVSS